MFHRSNNTVIARKFFFLLRVSSTAKTNLFFFLYNRWYKSYVELNNSACTLTWQCYRSWNLTEENVVTRASSNLLFQRWKGGELIKTKRATERKYNSVRFVRVAGTRGINKKLRLTFRDPTALNLETAYTLHSVLFFHCILNILFAVCLKTILSDHFIILCIFNHWENFPLQFYKNVLKNVWK